MYIDISFLVFGAAGAGLGSLKAHTLTKGISEFGFMDIPKTLTKEEKSDVEESDKVMEIPFEVDWKSKEVKVDPNIPHNEELEKEMMEELKKENDELQMEPTEEVEFEDKSPEENEEEEISTRNTGLRVCICVQGWLWKETELRTMWQPIRDFDPSAEVYSLRWETKELLHLGKCIVKTCTTFLAAQAAKFWIAAMSAFAAAILAALALPAAVILLSGAIDNSWTVVHNRAKKAGVVLAETLIEKIHGNRPVTLLGVSHGAQVVFSCMQHLVKLQASGKDVTGIVENVIILGGACSSDPKKWKVFKHLVPGRLVNGYCEKDWILGLIHRTAGFTKNPAGLLKVEDDCVENFDLTEIVSGHLAYKKDLDKILEVIQIGRGICQPDWSYIPPKPIEEEKEEQAESKSEGSPVISVVSEDKK